MLSGESPYPIEQLMLFKHFLMSNIDGNKERVDNSGAKHQQHAELLTQSPSMFEDFYAPMDWN